MIGVEQNGRLIEVEEAVGMRQHVLTERREILPYRERRGAEMHDGPRDEEQADVAGDEGPLGQAWQSGSPRATASWARQPTQVAGTRRARTSSSTPRTLAVVW